MRFTRPLLMIPALLLATGALAKPSAGQRARPALVRRVFPPNMRFDSALQAALQSAAPEGIEYYYEYLETNRFPGDNQSRVLSEYLRQKYAGHKLDVIISGATRRWIFFSSTDAFFFQMCRSSSLPSGPFRKPFAPGLGPLDSLSATVTEHGGSDAEVTSGNEATVRRKRNDEP